MVEGAHDILKSLKIVLRFSCPKRIPDRWYQVSGVVSPPLSVIQTNHTLSLPLACSTWPLLPPKGLSTWARVSYQ